MRPYINVNVFAVQILFSKSYPSPSWQNMNFDSVFDNVYPKISEIFTKYSIKHLIELRGKNFFKNRFKLIFANLKK